jgi:hypothetical protein
MNAPAEGHAGTTIQPPLTRRPSDRALIAISWTLIAGIYAYTIHMCGRRIPSANTGDFRHFYDAAVAMLGHENIYRSGTGGYIYPPLLAFLYLPLASLSRATAAWITLGTNAGMTLAATLLLSRAGVDRFFPQSPAHLGRRAAITIVAAISTLVMFDKFKGELQMWQTNIILLMMAALCITWLNRRPTLAGLCLGVAVNIKYLPIVLLPWLIARKRWKTIAGLCFGVPAFALLPALWTGLNTNLADLQVAFAGVLRILGFTVQASAANVEPLDVTFSISITSAFARFVSVARTPLALGLSAATAAVVATAILWMYVRARVPLWGPLDDPSHPTPNHQHKAPRRHALELFEFAGLWLIALAFSPQTNPRHLVLLTPFVVACAAALIAGPRALRLPLLASLLLLLAGLTLPPGIPSLKPIVDDWRWISGTSWVSVLCLLLAVWAILRTRPTGPTRNDDRVLPT